MIKLNHLAILLFYFSSLSCLSAQEVFFNQITSNLNGPTKICQTHNGGFAIATGSATGMALLKTDSWGNIVLQKEFHSSISYITPTDIIETMDKGFAISGKVAGYGIIIKADSLGSLMWSKSFESANFVNIKLNNICEYPNGELVVFGDKTNPLNVVDIDGFFIRFSPQGSVTFYRTYNNTGGAMSSDVEFQGLITNDNGLMIQGFHLNMFMKTDAVGNIQWTYNPFVVSLAPGVSKTYSDDFYIAVRDNPADGLRISKIDSAGFPKWDKTYKIDLENNWEYSIASTPDLGFVLLSRSYAAGSSLGRMPYILKCDSGGNVQYSILPIDTLGITGSTTFFPHDIIATSDSGFICSFQTLGGNVIKKYAMGSSFSCQDYPINITIVPSNLTTHITSYAQITGALNLVSNMITVTTPALSYNVICSNYVSAIPEYSAAINIYPNPAKDILFIQFPDDFTGCCEGSLSIMDMNGKIVFVSKSDFFNEGNIFQVDVNNFIPGMYILSMISQDKISYHKFVLGK